MTDEPGIDNLPKKLTLSKVTVSLLFPIIISVITTIITGIYTYRELSQKELQYVHSVIKDIDLGEKFNRDVSLALIYNHYADEKEDEKLKGIVLELATIFALDNSKSKDYLYIDFPEEIIKRIDTSRMTYVTNKRMEFLERTNWNCKFEYSSEKVEKNLQPLVQEISELDNVSISKEGIEGIKHSNIKYSDPIDKENAKKVFSIIKNYVPDLTPPELSVSNNSDVRRSVIIQIESLVSELPPKLLNNVEIGRHRRGDIRKPR